METDTQIWGGTETNLPLAFSSFPFFSLWSCSVIVDEARAGESPLGAARRARVQEQISPALAPVEMVAGPRVALRGRRSRETRREATYLRPGEDGSSQQSGREIMICQALIKKGEFSHRHISSTS